MANLSQFADIARSSAVDRLSLASAHQAKSAEHNQSVFNAAMAAMDAFQSEALSETAEDLSMVLGGRRQNGAARRGANEPQQRSRILALKLAAELSEIPRAEMEAHLDGDDAWLQASNPRAALAQQSTDPGQMALRMAHALVHAGLSGAQRRQLEIALGNLLAEDETVLSLFGALAFRPLTPNLRQDLRRLYQRATAATQSLSQWLTQLGPRDGRRQKLRTMIRVLAYELSASGTPIVGSHLAEVIGDLQRLLLLLGLEQYCDEAAARLACPELDAEGLLACVVQLTEQLWTDVDLVAQSLPSVAAAKQYDLAHTLAGLLPRLPLRCFVDADQRERLHGVLLALRDRFAD